MSSGPNTRERLIDGMRASLRMRGFGNTSMKELLNARGASGSMYRDASIADSWSDEDATRFAPVIVATYEGSLAVARAMKDTTPIDQAAQHLIDTVDSHRPSPEAP